MFIAQVAIFQVRPQCFDVVESLLADEDCPARQAHLAKGLFVLRLHMPLKTRHIRELLLGLTIWNHAVERPELQTGTLRLLSVVVNRFILRILLALLEKLFLLNRIPSQIKVFSDQDTFQA